MEPKVILKKVKAKGYNLILESQTSRLTILSETLATIDMDDGYFDHHRNQRANNILTTSKTCPGT